MDLLQGIIWLLRLFIQTNQNWKIKTRKNLPAGVSFLLTSFHITEYQEVQKLEERHHNIQLNLEHQHSRTKKIHIELRCLDKKNTLITDSPLLSGSYISANKQRGLQRLNAKSCLLKAFCPSMIIKIPLQY